MNQQQLEARINQIYASLLSPTTSQNELRALGLKLAEYVALRSGETVERMERDKGIYSHSVGKKPATHKGYWNRKQVAEGGYQITRIPYNGGFRYSVWCGSELIGCALELEGAKRLVEIFNRKMCNEN